MKVAAIITSGGVGKRMGADNPKQFLAIDGRPILLHTLTKFDLSEEVDFLAVVSPAEWLSETERLIKSANLVKEWVVIEGGAKRQDSVRRGLAALPKGTEIVVVHDGVRPFVKTAMIDESVEVARNLGACIVAIPVGDTIKRALNNNCIGETVDREKLWRAQTPQTFGFHILKKAFDEATKTGYYGTDDASLVERIGEKVRLIKGDVFNIKITTPEDLKLAEMLVCSLGVGAASVRQKR